MATEPKYDEDAVNLGYLKKIVADSEGNLNNIYENVSKHYASKPQPPYHKGDTWIDGDIIYTCINDRLIGTYQDSDWVTESGAKEEAEKKNKVFLRQPSNYSVGDMWILQSDTDHRAGKKGEMLISTAGRKVYDEDDWINMLGYGTIASINEVAHNLNDAIKRIGVTEDAIADGLIVTFYQNTIPEGKHIGDLWYVTETIEQFIKGKLYRYNGEKWEILKDPEITKAFEEANEARIVADGKIQSFYTAIAPLQNVGVGDLWIDTDDNNKLYRYNGTNWVAVYDTRIDTIQKEVETITETTVEIQTDLGQINNRVNTVETTITTLGQIEKAEGKKIKVDASNNPAKLRVWGNSVQEGIPSPSNIVPIRNVGDNIQLFYGELQNTSGGITTTFLDNKYILNGTTTGTYFDITKTSNKKLNIGNYIISIDTPLNLIITFKVYYKDSTSMEFPISKGSLKANVKITKEVELYNLFAYGFSTGTVLDNVSFTFKLEQGSTPTPYTPYGCGSADFKVENQDKTQSKIVSFPFSKGQVLHKGDYLASDGIHQKRKTLVLNGNENWLLAAAKDNTTHFQCTVTSDKKAGITNIISSHFKTQYELDENGIFGASASSFIQIYIDKAIATTVTELKAYLQEQYAKGTPVTVEYELAKEVVIPYTPKQQKVLDNIKTFKGVNYIYCIDEIKPEKIVLEYYPNTPYNDTLVNKDTFDKVTTEMNAEFNIKANEIETSVKESTTASILTLLNNGYLTAERVNALVNGNAEDIATVKEQLKQTVTSSQMQIEITKAIEGGVSYLKNTLFTIDEKGMTIATNQDEFNALYNNKGMYLYSFDEMIAKFDVNGATIEGNLNLNGEFVTPNLRMMNVKVSGVAHTHIHWIGG